MASLFRKLFRRQKDKPEISVKEGELSKLRIRDFLPGNPVIIEAGAHVGKDTVEMSRVWPEGRIHAFEPMPDLYKKLRKHTRHCSNVTLYPLALANRSGPAVFNVSSGNSNASSSILAPKAHVEQYPDVIFDEKITVEAITIEDWAARYRVPQVDFLWLDMQGYELFALKAAGKILPKVRVIFTEVFLKELYADAPLYPEVRKWLEGEGFAVEWEAFPSPGWGNVLFVRK